MIAFTAHQDEYTHIGSPEEITYKNEVLACSGHWDKTTFTCPEDGVYYFTISFVRDSQYPPGGGQPGTNDDTYIRLLKNGQVVVQAFAGEGSGRRSAFVAATIALITGDEVSTSSHAIGDAYRRFRNCVFSGFRLG